MPPPGFVDLITEVPRLTVRARLAADPPRITQGFGGWEEVERPRRKSITRFAGRPAMGMELPLLLSGWAEGSAEGLTANVSVEDDYQTMERMATPLRPGAEPPTVILDGPVPWKDKRWVINGIAPGPMIRSMTGQRIRAEVTLTLLEYVADDRVEFKKAAAQVREADAEERAKKAFRSADRTSPPGRRTYTVRQGEDLQQIAGRQLGDYRMWQNIADINGIRDPLAVIEGQVIILP